MPTSSSEKHAARAIRIMGARQDNACPASAQTATTRAAVALQLVGRLRQIVGELARELERFVLVDLVLDDERGEKAAVHAPRDVVARRDRKERARVVVEPDRVVEARGLDDLLAKPLHAFGAVVEPPGRSELQDRIVAPEGRELRGR